MRSSHWFRTSFRFKLSGIGPKILLLLNQHKVSLSLGRIFSSMHFHKIIIFTSIPFYFLKFNNIVLFLMCLVLWLPAIYSKRYQFFIWGNDLKFSLKALFKKRVDFLNYNANTDTIALRVQQKSCRWYSWLNLRYFLTKVCNEILQDRQVLSFVMRNAMPWLFCQVRQTKFSNRLSQQDTWRHGPKTKELYRFGDFFFKLCCFKTTSNS